MPNRRIQKTIILGLITIAAISAFGQPSTAWAQEDFVPASPEILEQYGVEAPPLKETPEERETRFQQYERNRAASAGEAESCGWFDIPCWIRSAISYIGQFFTEIFGVVLWLVGLAFDLSVKISITDLATYADSGGVRVAWSTLRDLANVFFIFILLYIAIGMILQLPSINGRRMLVSVIIIALLINFSAFFARLVIDASNVAAVQFFNTLSNSSETSRLFGYKGISATFMNALPMAKAIANTGGTFINTTAIAFGNVIMILVAIFVFLTATILFVVRTVTLIMLIILSPLAFLMYAFPNQKGLFDKWWDTLLKQAFFAPLFLIMVYVTVLILQSDSLAQILQTSENAGLTIALHFMITIGFMFGAIIIAKSLGAKGASAAMKGAGALTGAAAGAVGWGTKKGLANLWKARTAEGRAELKAKGKETWAKTLTTLKDLKTSPLKTTAKGIQLAEKKLPLGKQVGEFVRQPLKTTAEGLAAVTKEYGIPGILGRTKDEEREWQKKQKEEKETRRRQELKEYNDKLERMSEKDVAGAAEIMGKMKSKEIAGLNKKAQLNPATIFNYTEDDLEAMNREGVDTEVMGKIYEEIRNDPQHRAFDYVMKSPSRASRRGAPTPPAAPSSPPSQLPPPPPAPPPPSSNSNPPTAPPQAGGPRSGFKI